MLYCHFNDHLGTQARLSARVFGLQVSVGQKSRDPRIIDSTGTCGWLQR